MIDVDALLSAELLAPWGSAAAPSVALAPLADLPPADRGVVAALGDPALHDGRKHSICGSVGGLMRKCGMSRERCEAVLREWLAPIAGPSCDVDAGVRYAVSAWAKPASEVSGVEALAQHIGAEHAALVQGAIIAMRMPPKFAPVVEAPAPVASEFANGADFDWMAAEAPIEWYCQGLGIAPSERKVTLIAGDPGSGKGPLAGYLAVCFAFGLKAFGVHECKRCNVGVLDFEGARLSARRIRSYARGFAKPGAALRERLFLRDCDPGTSAADIMQWCVARAIDVLIIDSYMSAMSAFDTDPNSPDYAALARDLGSFGIVVIVIAHARKVPQGKRGERPALGDVAGSFALAGMAATAIVLWRPSEDDTLLVRVGCARAPDEAFQSFDVRWTRGGTEAEPVWTAAVAGLATRDAREQSKALGAQAITDLRLTESAKKIIASMYAHNTPQSANAIGKDTGEHQRDVGRVLSALERAKLATRHVEPRCSTWNLVTDDAGKPPSVTIVGGEVVAAPGVVAAPPPSDGVPRLGKFAKPPRPLAER